jgi:hypothetical protein
MGLHIGNGQWVQHRALICHPKSSSIFNRYRLRFIVFNSLVNVCLSILGGRHHDGTLAVGRRAWCHFTSVAVMDREWMTIVVVDGLRG